MGNHEPYIKGGGNHYSWMIPKRLKDMTGKQQTAGPCSSAARTVQSGKAVEHTGRRENSRPRKCSAPARRPAAPAGSGRRYKFLFPAAGFCSDSYPSRLSCKNYDRRLYYKIRSQANLIQIGDNYMRRSSSDLKALARQALSGQWGLPVAACLLIFICSFILTLVITALLNPYSVLSIITCQIMIYIVSLFISLFQAGYMKLLLNMNRKEPFSLKDLISPFTLQPDRFLTVNLILLLAEVLLSLPLYVLSYRTSGMTSLSFSLGGSLITALVGTYPLPVLRTVQLSASG